MIVDVDLYDSQARTSSDPAAATVADAANIARLLDQASAACDAFGATLPRRCPPPPMPPLTLIASPDMIACDLLGLGFQFASARLREVLQAPADDVAFLPVNDDACPAHIRQADYRLMHVSLHASPIDMDRTQGRIVDAPLPDGSVAKRWLPKGGGPSGAARLYAREGFAPPGPIFAVPVVRWILVEDAVADRVMRAGLTGVIFVDMFAAARPGELVRRTL